MLPSNPGMLGIGMVDGTAGASDRIGPGESMVIYTDGLTDAMDPSDVLFGEERLQDACFSRTTAPIPARSSSRSNKPSQSTRHLAGRPTTSTSSSCSISRSDCSPSLPEHVKLKLRDACCGPATRRALKSHSVSRERGPIGSCSAELAGARQVTRGRKMAGEQKEVKTILLTGPITLYEVVGSSRVVEHGTG